MQGIILVNGYPGVGKLTICRELHRLIPGSKLFSNHNLIDTAASLFERDHPLFYKLRHDLRQTIFQNLILSNSQDLSPKHQITHLIFTEAQSDDPIGSSVCREYLAFAQTLNIPLYSVILSCSEEENIRRLTSRESSVGSTKLLDGGILRDIRKSALIYRFAEGTEGVKELELEVEGLAPVVVAELIVEHLGLSNQGSQGHGEDQDISPYSQPGPSAMAAEQAGTSATSTSPFKPLAIGSTPHNPPQPEPEVQTLDVGGGNIVRLDALGPMIINSDGTLSRIQNWQDLHPIEQERTVRLLVKKRNLVRLQKLEAEEGGVVVDEKLSISK